MQSSTHNLVLAPDAAIDLQVHTTYSDGSWTPEQLVDHLAAEGFGLAAITDHDRADTAPVLQKLAAEKNMPLVVAVEMSTSWQGEMTDILCFGFDVENNALDTLARDLWRRQQENVREAYDNLVRQGYKFQSEGETQVDELTELLEKPCVQLPFALVNLLKKYGYGNAEVSAGKMAVGAGLAMLNSDINAVVDAAHRSGAVALIAHPGRSDGFTTFDAEKLDELRKTVPIDGIEVYYPAHSPEQTTMFMEYAQKHKLLTSSGSDSHGTDKLPIKYLADLSRNLLEQLGIRVG